MILLLIKHLLDKPGCAQAYCENCFRIIGIERSIFHLGILDSICRKTRDPLLFRQKEFVFALGLLKKSFEALYHLKTVIIQQKLFGKFTIFIARIIINYNSFHWIIWNNRWVGRFKTAINRIDLAKVLSCTSFVSASGLGIWWPLGFFFQYFLKLSGIVRLFITL